MAIPREIQNEPRKPEFYHIKVAQKAYKKVDRDPERVKLLGNALERLTHDFVANTELVTVDGITFPVSHVNITDFARYLLAIPREKDPNLHPTQPDLKVRQPSSVNTDIEFNLVSAPQLQNGHPFTFIEEVMKQTMGRLPRTIRDLQAGKRPQEAIVYTLGTPTNRDWGFMPQEYADQVKQSPYETIGGTYATYITSLLHKREWDRSDTSIRMYGISMGAAYAGKTAEKLLHDGVVTQDRATHPDLPYVSVIMDSPVSFNAQNVSEQQMTRRFAADIGIHHLPWNFNPTRRGEGIWNPGVLSTPKKENEFLSWFEEQLRPRGIDPIGQQAGQAELKADVLHTLVGQMGGALKDLDPGIRINLRRGVKDWLSPGMTYEDPSEGQSWRQRAQRRLDSAQDSLGATLMSTANPNWREGAVRSGHLIPFFNRGEMRKWRKTADALQRVLK